MSQAISVGIAVVPPELFTYLPAFALILTVTSFAFDYSSAGRLATRLGPVRSFEDGGSPYTDSVEDRQYVVVSRRALVSALQIAVGSLVTFGGTAYVVFALNALGTAFGSGHLLVGISGLSIGIWTASRKALPRNALLGINIVTIAYSLLSDTAAGVLTLLPTDAFHDSVIGTAAAVIMSSALVYLLARRETTPPREFGQNLEATRTAA